MFRPIFFAVVVCSVVCGGLCQTARSQDAAGKVVENPDYRTWSAHKPGTSITLTLKQTVDGATKTQTVVMRLVEIQADKLVLETETATKELGKEVKQPPMKVDIPKTLSGATGALIDNPPGKVADGTEKITVAGKTYEAQWIKTEMKQGETIARMKLYFSEKVPGRLLRMEAKVEGPGASTMAMELVEVTLK